MRVRDTKKCLNGSFTILIIYNVDIIYTYILYEFTSYNIELCVVRCYLLFARNLEITI